MVDQGPPAMRRRLPFWVKSSGKSMSATGPLVLDEQTSVSAAAGPRIAQRVRHYLRIAEIAHEHLFIGERKRSGPAVPTRSPMARARNEIDTFTIPEGRRRRVYQPWHNIDAGMALVSNKTMLDYRPAGPALPNSESLSPRKPRKRGKVVRAADIRPQ
jgi:hypothetical protein